MLNNIMTIKTFLAFVLLLRTKRNALLKPKSFIFTKTDNNYTRVRKALDTRLYMFTFRHQYIIKSVPLFQNIIIKNKKKLLISLMRE